VCGVTAPIHLEKAKAHLREAALYDGGLQKVIWALDELIRHLEAK
jgi:hypothetical protein